AVAQGMLDRILADHAAPKISTSNSLKPFDDPEYYDKNKQQPIANKSPYLDDKFQDSPWLKKIYRMEPSENVSPTNGLIRLSKPDTALVPGVYPKNPFIADEWAYLRQKALPSD